MVKEFVYDPSIGQVEYLNYLDQQARQAQTDDFVLIEMPLDYINSAAAEQSVAYFVNRHESIRTIFPSVEGKRKQLVLSPSDPRFQLHYIDMKPSAVSFEEARKKYFNKSADTIGDTQKGPLIKFFLFKNNNQDYCFSLLIHHIICDAWSVKVIKEELIYIYQEYAEGCIPDMEPLPVQLKDYCARQNTWLTEEKHTLVEYWKDRLNGYDKLFDLEGFYKFYNDNRTQSISPPWSGESLNSPEGLLKALNEGGAASYIERIVGQNYAPIKLVATDNRWSVTAIVYTSLYFLLHFYAGRRKILLAALIADRFDHRYDAVIGCLLGGTYFPRTITDNKVVGDLIREVYLDIINNCERIIPSHEFLQLDGMTLRVSSDIYINYQRRRGDIYGQPGEPGKHMEIQGLCYGLECVICEFPDGLWIDWKYNTSLFARELFEDLINCHKRILQCICENGNETVARLKEVVMES